MVENDNKTVKEELLANISELFLKYGLRSTSMDDICSHLKISKKTLYQFFSNKDDVVEQTMLYRREYQQTKHNQQEWQQFNAVEMMWRIRQHIIKDFSSRMPTNLFDLKKYHPEVYERLNQENSIFIHKFLMNILEKGIKEEFFRPNIDQEVEIYLFVKQMSILGEPEMISEIRYPYERIVTTLVDNFIRSIATPAGIAELEKIEKETEK